MKQFLKDYIWLFKQHPLLMLLLTISGCMAGVLLGYLIIELGLEIYVGIKDGTINTISIVSIAGAVAGIVSLFWLVIEKVMNKPDIKIHVELIENEGNPDKIAIIAVNSGKAVELNKAGFILSDDTHVYVVSFTGLLPVRVKSSQIPYTCEIDLSDIVAQLKGKNLTIKTAFIEDSNRKRFTCEIPNSIADTVNNFIEKQSD